MSYKEKYPNEIANDMINYIEKQCALDIQQGGTHYKTMKIQPVEYILANNLGFIEGCVVKYVSRWKNKNGVEDLKKAKHFLDLLIEDTEKQNDIRRARQPDGCGDARPSCSTTDSTDQSRPVHFISSGSSIDSIRCT